MTDNITFAQLRAALQAAGEVIEAPVSVSTLESRLPEICDRHNAVYRPELIDLAALLVGFGERVARSK
ncbi:MAG TPA: hypothetical protein VG757_08235 [Devosia sp.]|nr:hypothetical protein [Devosia sp.]